MPAARQWTPAELDRMRTLAAAGTPLRKIASELGTSASTVQRKLAALGVEVDRSRTEAATQAFATDAKARRARLEVALLDDAERLRAQVWQPHLYFEWGGKDHEYAEKRTDEPNPTDKLKLLQAAGVAIDRSLKIAEHDRDTGTAEAVGALDAIEQAIREAAAQLGPLDDNGEPLEQPQPDPGGDT